MNEIKIDAIHKTAESDLLAAIVRNSASAIIVHDLNGMIRIWNRGSEILFGHSQSIVLGTNINALIAVPDQQTYERHIASLLQGDTAPSIEIRGVTREGRHPDMEANGCILFDSDGRPTAIATTFRNITEAKSIENKLIALVESTPDPFIIVEADGRIQRINRQAEILFGYHRHELIGKSFKVLVPERYRSQHDFYTRNYQVKPIMRQMGSGLELWCLTRSGEEIPVEIGLSPVVVQDETTIMVRFRDVREQKREQAQLHRAIQKADEANRTKSRFLAAASHDLRQPLQSISMNLGVLAKTLSEADKEHVIAQTRMALDTTNKLLNSLLNITMLESGKVQPEIETFYLGEVLKRVYNTESQQAREKSHVFSLRNSSLAVTSDPALLEQLLTNLVANAIRYTPPNGHIVLGCRRLKAHIRIEIADNGPGIAADALDFIFDEYRQLEFTRPFQGMGLGLGLSIVKLLAQLLHLKLEVRSIPGKGSCFSIVAPIATDRPKLERTKQVATILPEKKTGTILLIDDDEAVLDSTNIFLGVSGFRVVVARNSAEATELLKTETPDLIITDYGLAQQETGIDLLKRIREVLKKNVPAIVVTGNTSVQRNQATDTGENIEIVSKPIDPYILLQLVQKHF